MDIYYSLHVKNTTTTAAANLLQLRNYSILEKPNSSWNMKKMMKKTASPSGSCYPNTYRSFVVRAMAKKNPSSSGNGDKSIPEGDGLKGRDPSTGNNESNDAASQKAHPKPLDWREFRALLYINEQEVEPEISGVLLDQHDLIAYSNVSDGPVELSQNPFLHPKLLTLNEFR